MRKIITKIVRHITSWAWQDEIQTCEGVAVLKELHADEKGMEIHIKQNPEAAKYMAHCMAELVCKSPNYTELKFEMKNPTDKFDWITVLVQKGKGKTPHELRAEAEAKLESQIEETAVQSGINP